MSDFELDDFRWSALARYHDNALEAANVLVAFARMKVHSHWDYAESFGVRRTIKIMDLMHQFALNARKAIEISENYVPGIKAAAKKTKLDGSGREVEVDIGERIILCDEDFWWIIGRIIHSQEVHVEDETILGDVSERHIESDMAPKFFGFRSDFDESETMHYISIEGLIQCYVDVFSGKIEEAKRIRSA